IRFLQKSDDLLFRIPLLHVRPPGVLGRTLNHGATQFWGNVGPHGHPAIQASLPVPVDDVQILISPATHIVDKVRGQRWPEDQYYFSLLNKEGVEIAMSRGHYGWDDAIKLATFFKGKSVEQALMWWARRKL
ncbi:hypothetical protein, partial [Solimonas sp. SE-A11]|uniref:hypothetical protein n=1 Tax=Solimonas sp. SE-A11 TaxID=3054954 RepID=UPI00259D16A3